MEKLRLCLSGVGKPLEKLPAIFPVTGAADKVQGRGIAGKAGGFNIKKQEIRQGPQPFQRIGGREIYGVTDSNHRYGILLKQWNLYQQLYGTEKRKSMKIEYLFD